MKLTPLPMQRIFEVLVGFVLFQHVAANVARNPVGVVLTAVAVFALCAHFIKGGIAARVWKNTKRRAGFNSNVLLEVLALYLLFGYVADNVVSNPVGSLTWLAVGLAACNYLVPDGITARLVRAGRSRWSASRATNDADGVLSAPADDAPVAVAPSRVTAPILGDPSMN